MRVVYAAEGAFRLDVVLRGHDSGECVCCLAPPLTSGLLAGFARHTRSVGSSSLDAVMSALALATADRGLLGGIAPSPPGWDDVVTGVLDDGLGALSDFLVAASRTPGLTMEWAAFALVTAVARAEGRDAGRWSPTSRWVVSAVNGFLSPAAACEILPVGAFLSPSVPGIAPCLVNVLAGVCAEAPPAVVETMSLLAPEWEGSLSELLTAASVL